MPKPTSGNLLWPILLPATTDPGIFLQAAHPAAGPLTSVAGLGNVAVIAEVLISLIFIRGRTDSSGENPQVAGQSPVAWWTFE